MKGGWRPASLVQPVKCSDLAADLFPMANQPVVAGAGSTASQGNTAGLKGAISKVLANPIMGFAPWIVFSVLEGPHRYPLATGAALALAVLELLLGVVVGARPKILDVAAIVFFAGMLVAGLLIHHDGHVWLDRWSGEVSNAMLVLVALASIVVRAPFTIQYAREMTPEEYWRTPLFIHINYVLTWVWTAVFAVTAAVGWYGDGPLNQPDNIWTNWIVQIALLIFAIRFTEWYPDVAAARAFPDSEKPGETPGSIASLFLPLAGYLVPIGIVLLALGDAPTWVGVALIVVGALAARFLHGQTGSSSSSGDSVMHAGPNPA